MKDIIAGIKVLADLPDNWDGHGADIVAEQVIKNTLDLVRRLDSNYVELLDPNQIHATPDGTITLEWKIDGGYFIIEMGITRIVYFYDVDKKIGGQTNPTLYREDIIADIEDVMSMVF